MSEAVIASGQGAANVPLESLDLSTGQLFAASEWKPVFARLRSEDPLHYQAESPFGPFWSATTHALIPQIELRPDIFTTSFEVGGIGLMDADGSQGFVSLDGPKHKEQRRVVTPAFEPAQLRAMEASIRERTCRVLDSLPIDEEFDWVERVAVEITTQMLARLVDFEPWEERRRLTAWSEWVVNSRARLDPALNAEREKALQEMTAYFSAVMEEKRGRLPEADLISRLAHSETMAQQSWEERLGNISLLIVGGNDTTRHSMSGMVMAFNQYPDEWTRLRSNPELVENAVLEIIRWQSPITHLRRTCLEEFEIAGRKIRKGDKVLTWYISANRDEEVFQDADRLIIDRPNSRDLLSFGIGVHRCAGARLAQLQIRVLLEEMIRREMTVELTREPSRLGFVAINGIVKLPVRVRRG